MFNKGTRVVLVDSYAPHIRVRTNWEIEAFEGGKVILRHRHKEYTLEAEAANLRTEIRE